MAGDKNDNLEQRILLEISSDDPRVFKKLKNYASYINEVLSAQTESGLYIEDMASGFLFIYKNAEILRKMNDPRHPYVQNGDELESFNTSPQSIDETENNKKAPSSFFLDNDIYEENFPEDGINMYYSLKTTEDEKILKVFEDFINFNENKNFTMKRMEDNTLKVTFHSYPAFLEYCQNVERLFVINL